MEATLEDNFLHHNLLLSQHIAQAMGQIQHPYHPLHSATDLHLELDLSMLVSALMASQAQSLAMMEAITKLPKPRKGLR